MVIMDKLDYQYLFRFIPSPVVLLKPDFTIIDASEAYVNHTKKKRDELIGVNLFDRFPESTESKNMASRVKEGLHKAIETLQTQQMQTFRYDLQDPSGKWTPHFWKATTYPVLKDGKLLYLVHQINDMTESVKQDKLIDVGKRDDIFRLLIENIRDYAVFVLDTKGYICSWNSGAQRVKLYTAEEIIGKHFSIFYTQEDLEKEKPKRELENALKYGRTEDEYWRVKKDGSLFWGNVVITALYDDNKQHIGFVKVTRDLTERKSNEQKVIQAYEESARLKAEFLANMSHEIRTPMNGITSAVKLLKDTPAGNENSDLMDIILKSTDSMVKLINDIIDYSKIESDRTQVINEPFDIHKEVEEVFTNLKSQIEKAVEMSLNIDKDVPQMVLGDRLRYHQVLSNVIDNAIKFTDVGFVKVRLFILERQGMRVVLAISVEDSGKGIAENDIPKLFTPLSQLESFSTKKYRGTGMGLSICKRLLDLMGGSIKAESVVGKGSTFTFWVGMKQYRQIQQNPPTAKRTDATLVAPEYPEASILIAEDNTINQNVILRVLRKIGYSNLTLVENGQMAVEKIKLHQFDLVLMDIQMPVMDGVEATKLIREMNPSIPIIALTANAVIGDSEKYLQSGMNDYISKPIDFKKLSAMLNRWL